MLLFLIYTTNSNKEYSSELWNTLGPTYNFPQDTGSSLHGFSFLGLDVLEDAGSSLCHSVESAFLESTHPIGNIGWMNQPLNVLAKLKVLQAKICQVEHEVLSCWIHLLLPAFK